MFLRFVDDFIDSYSDPRARSNYPICEPAAIAAVYMLFVKGFGPRFMENRKPLDIKKIVLVYDAIQVIVNFYFVLAVIREILHMSGSFFCLEMAPLGSSRSEAAFFLTKFYYWLKISDLLDTIFFVLKKSWRQVSYLHVYHHAIMIFSSWLAIKLAPGGHCAYFGLANAFVHTVMYTYYLLTAYNNKWKQNIRLKKSVTQIQLVQFVFIITMFFPTLFNNCYLPPAVGIIASSQSAYFLYLFGMFYYNNYFKPSTEKGPTKIN